MSSWRHRGWRITRSVFAPGNYTAKRGDQVREWPSRWGLAGIRRDLDAEVEAEEKAERERQRLADLRRRQRLEAEERERLWVRRLPSTTCRKCGSPHVDAYTEDGHRLPLDVDPDPRGHWVIVAQRVEGRSPVIRRATDEPIADRYEIHHATCRRRLPLVDSTGQMNLAIGRWVQLADRRPRRRRRQRAPLQLNFDSAAEQLELPCPT